MQSSPLVEQESPFRFPARLRLWNGTEFRSYWPPLRQLHLGDHGCHGARPAWTHGSRSSACCPARRDSTRASILFPFEELPHRVALAAKVGSNRTGVVQLVSRRDQQHLEAPRPDGRCIMLFSACATAASTVSRNSEQPSDNRPRAARSGGRFPPASACPPDPPSHPCSNAAIASSSSGAVCPARSCPSPQQMSDVGRPQGLAAAALGGAGSRRPALAVVRAENRWVALSQCRHQGV